MGGGFAILLLIVTRREVGVKNRQKMRYVIYERPLRVSPGMSLNDVTRTRPMGRGGGGGGSKNHPKFAWRHSLAASAERPLINIACCPGRSTSDPRRIYIQTQTWPPFSGQIVSFQIRPESGFTAFISLSPKPWFLRPFNFRVRQIQTIWRFRSVIYLPEAQLPRQLDPQYL